MCSTSCFSRAIVQALNIALLVGGILTIIVAIIIANDKIWGIILDQFWICLVCFGAFLVILAAMALCGFSLFCSTCQWTKATFSWIYIVVLTLLILGQVGIVVFVLVAQSDFKSFLNDRWNDLSAEQRHEIQIVAECQSTWTISSSLEELVNGEISSETVREEDTDASFEDCYEKIKDGFTGEGVLAIVVAAGVLVLQIVSLVASCCLACEDKRVQPRPVGPPVGVNMV